MWTWIRYKIFMTKPMRLRRWKHLSALTWELRRTERLLISHGKPVPNSLGDRIEDLQTELDALEEIGIL